VKQIAGTSSSSSSASSLPSSASILFFVPVSIFYNKKLNFDIDIFVAEEMGINVMEPAEAHKFEQEKAKRTESA
jgi:hypothetical protein